ncbi:MAG TPA: S4 domain-containing protein [Paracoccaceae bacterium]|nr:S4 domain-containing protein [Paracoccaceae bacterium]HMO73071.1 S4 domain-containing protein [Paracoccaceae bacterium]
MAADARPVLRIDRWLFQARFFRARDAASGMVEAGHCRLNGRHVTKPAQPVGAGDVLTFPQAGRIRVVRVLAVGRRRGPATEAQALYADLDADRDAAPAALE